MQRTVPLLLLVLACALPAAAADDTVQHIGTVHQVVELAVEGHALVSIHLSDIVPATAQLAIPFNSKELVDQVSCNEANVVAERVSRNGSTYLQLTSRDGDVIPDVTISYRTADYDDWISAGIGQFGAIKLNYEFLNTAAIVIDSFSGEVVLPRGYIVQAISKTTPSEGETSTQPPYIVDRKTDRHSLTIDCPRMTIGERASLAFTARKEEQSIVVFLICGIIAILYLLFFRDVLKPGEVGE